MSHSSVFLHTLSYTQAELCRPKCFFFKSGIFAAKILNIVVLTGHNTPTYFVFYGCAQFVYRSSSNLCSHISTAFHKRLHPADPATDTSVSNTLFHLLDCSYRRHVQYSNHTLYHILRHCIAFLEKI